MSTTYLLPEQTRLDFSRDGVANPMLYPGYTQNVQAQWQRSYTFIETGHADGLYMAWGSMTGQLTAVDLMLDSDYAHAATADSAAPSANSGQLWVPNDLTPVSANALVTTAVALYFNASGSGGTAFATYECIARPEQVRPELLATGILAATVAWRWEINDDTPPTITT